MKLKTGIKSGVLSQAEKDEVLHAHNAVRAESPTLAPLRWNEELARGAQAWAEKMAQSEGLNHAPKTEVNWFGTPMENIAYHFPKWLETPSATYVVTDQWCEPCERDGTCGTHYRTIRSAQATKLGCGAVDIHFGHPMYAQKRDVGPQRFWSCRYDRE